MPGDASILVRAFSLPKWVREILTEKMQVEEGIGVFHWRISDKVMQALVKGGYAEERELHENSPERRGFYPTQKAITARQDIDSALLLLNKGVPLSERPKNLPVGKAGPLSTVPYMSRTETVEYQIGTYDGRPFYSNTHFLIEGNPPEGVQTREVKLERYIPAIRHPEIFPEYFSYDGKTGQVHFSNGHAVDAKYFDLFRDRFPRATYHTESDKLKAVAVCESGKIVGLIMPMFAHEGFEKPQKEEDSVMSGVCRNVRVSEQEDGIHVVSPYYSKWVEWSRGVKGTWNGKEWVYPTAIKDVLLSSLTACYGENGQGEPDYVEVEMVFKDRYSSACGPAELFSKTIARAIRWNSGAKIGEQAFFLSGAPCGGGTAKNWSTDIPVNSVVRIVAVPRALYERKANLYEGFAECRIVENGERMKPGKVDIVLPKVEPDKPSPSGMRLPDNIPEGSWLCIIGPKALEKLDKVAQARGTDRGRCIIGLIREVYDLVEIGEEIDGE